MIPCCVCLHTWRVKMHMSVRVQEGLPSSLPFVQIRCPVPLWLDALWLQFRTGRWHRQLVGVCLARGTWVAWVCSWIIIMCFANLCNVYSPRRHRLKKHNWDTWPPNDVSSYMWWAHGMACLQIRSLCGTVWQKTCEFAGCLWLMLFFQGRDSLDDLGVPCSGYDGRCAISH
jgi:hypothetical protein